MKSLDVIFIASVIIFIIGCIVIALMFYYRTPPFNSVGIRNPMTGERYTDSSLSYEKGVLINPSFKKDVEPGNVCGKWCNEIVFDSEIRDIYERFE